jgi:hypothetical protein
MFYEDDNCKVICVSRKLPDAICSFVQTWEVTDFLSEIKQNIHAPVCINQEIEIKHTEILDLPLILLLDIISTGER